MPELICPRCKKSRRVKNQHIQNKKTDLCLDCARKVNAENCAKAMKKAKQKKADFQKAKCDNCEKEIRLSRKERDRYALHFCDRKCRDSYYEKLIPRTICDECGKEFQRSRSGLVKTKKTFCSFRCVYKNMRLPPLIVTCETCKEKFIISRQQFKRKKTGGRINKYFCSKECYWKYMIRDSPPDEIKAAAVYLGIGYKEAKEKGYLPYLKIRALHKNLKGEITKNGN